MPSLFTVGGYRVFFWSNEEGEPVHVHVTKGVPAAGATKIWLTRSGGCVLAHNDSRIPAKDLRELIELIAAQHEYICREWKRFFVTSDIAFFC